MLIFGMTGSDEISLNRLPVGQTTIVGLYSIYKWNSKAKLGHLVVILIQIDLLCKFYELTK